MRKRVVDKDFSGKEMHEATIADRVFIGDSFDRAFLGHRTYIRCIFIGCSFRLTSFDRSNFVRCVFQGCDFAGAFLDTSKFIDCHANLCLFIKVQFCRTEFGFLSTDHCTFAHADMPVDLFYPASCRELMAELIRKAGDDPGILAAAGLVYGWPEFCWETLCKTIMQMVGAPTALKILQHLRRFSSLHPFLEKWAELGQTES